MSTKINYRKQQINKLIEKEKEKNMMKDMEKHNNCMELVEKLEYYTNNLYSKYIPETDLAYVGKDVRFMDIFRNKFYNTDCDELKKFIAEAKSDNIHIIKMYSGSNVSRMKTSIDSDNKSANIKLI